MIARLPTARRKHTRRKPRVDAKTRGEIESQDGDVVRLFPGLNVVVVVISHLVVVSHNSTTI